jgi:transposase
MIPHGVEVFVGLDPIDLRWGFDRLSGVITEKLGRSSRSGAMFVFFGKRRTALKILFFDGGGLCVFYKRLDRGTFRIPGPADEGAAVLTIGERELEDLLDGVDLEPDTSRRKPTAH